ISINVGKGDVVRYSLAPWKGAEELRDALPAMHCGWQWRKCRVPGQTRSMPILPVSGEYAQESPYGEQILEIQRMEREQHLSYSRGAMQRRCAHVERVPANCARCSVAVADRHRSGNTDWHRGRLRYG